MAAHLTVCVLLLCLAAGPFSFFASAVQPPALESCVPTSALTLNNTVTVVLDPNGGESCFSWNTLNVGGIGVVDHHPPLMVDYYYLFNNDSNACGISQTTCKGSNLISWLYCKHITPHFSILSFLHGGALYSLLFLGPSYPSSS